MFTIEETALRAASEERLPFVVLTHDDELLGFACAAPWRGYQHGRWLDTILMQRSL